MSVNIKQTLTDNINGENVLNFASGLFPGIIETAINYYLNGVSIPVGNNTSLKVSDKGADIELIMDSVVFEGTATADQATLKISGTGKYTDAYIKVTFVKKNESEVTINLDATTGNSLAWKLSDLWPDLLDKEPFSDVTFQKGQLTLKIDGSDNIDFSGLGSVYYKSAALATGTIKIIYDGKAEGTPDASKVSVLVGVVVDYWSPGTIWTPLNDITFKESGLIFSSIAESNSSTIADLHLIDNTKVPAIVNGNFKVKEGITFFTTLELTNFLKPLTSFLGENQTLALYANSDLSKKLTLIAKYTAANFKPSKNAIFEFEDFKLEWDLDIGSSYAITASADGRFFPPDGSENGIELTLNSTIKPSEGDVSIGLAIGDWEHPFGYQHLIIKKVEADFLLGASAEGVTLELSGDFEFETDGGKRFEFGVAGEITDFEVPTGIAFLLKPDSPMQELSIGDLINGITSISLNHIPVMNTINNILQIKNVDFAVVESASLKIEHKTFNKGFTAVGEFDVLQQEKVIVNVEITGASGAEQFSGLANLEQAVTFGDIFLLCKYNKDTDQPDTNYGPEIAVSSKGMVVGGVNNGNPVYFYANGYLEILDIIKAKLYGIATTDGLFEFVESVNTGTTVGDTGVWQGKSITVGLNPNEYSFEAAFDFDFGWKNVSIGPLQVWAVNLIPKIKLPNFDISTGLGIYVDGKKLKLTVKGEFNFDFLGLKLNYGSPQDFKTIFSIDLGNAPKTLSDIKDKIWNWLLDNLGDLIKDTLNVLSKFVDWAKKELLKLGVAIENIAKAIYNGFTTVALDIANALKNIGYAASEIYQTMVNDLKIAAEKVEEAVDKAFATIKGCAIETAAKL